MACRILNSNISSLVALCIVYHPCLSLILPCVLLISVPDLRFQTHTHRHTQTHASSNTPLARRLQCGRGHSRPPHASVHRIDYDPPNRPQTTFTRAAADCFFPVVRLSTCLRSSCTLSSLILDTCLAPMCPLRFAFHFPPFQIFSGSVPPPHACATPACNHIKKRCTTRNASSHSIAIIRSSPPSSVFSITQF